MDISKEQQALAAQISALQGSLAGQVDPLAALASLGLNGKAPVPTMPFGLPAGVGGIAGVGMGVGGVPGAGVALGGAAAVPGDSTAAYNALMANMQQQMLILAAQSGTPPPAVVTPIIPDASPIPTPPADSPPSSVQEIPDTTDRRNGLNHAAKPFLPKFGEVETEDDMPPMPDIDKAEGATPPPAMLEEEEQTDHMPLIDDDSDDSDDSDDIVLTAVLRAQAVQEEEEEEEQKRRDSPETIPEEVVPEVEEEQEFRPMGVHYNRASFPPASPQPDAPPLPDAPTQPVATPLPPSPPASLPSEDKTVSPGSTSLPVSDEAEQVPAAVKMPDAGMADPFASAAAQLGIDPSTLANFQTLQQSMQGLQSIQNVQNLNQQLQMLVNGNMGMQAANPMNPMNAMNPMGMLNANAVNMMYQTQLQQLMQQPQQVAQPQVDAAMLAQMPNFALPAMGLAGTPGIGVLPMPGVQPTIPLPQPTQQPNAKGDVRNVMDFFGKPIKAATPAPKKAKDAPRIPVPQPLAQPPVFDANEKELRTLSAINAEDLTAQQKARMKELKNARRTRQVAATRFLTKEDSDSSLTKKRTPGEPSPPGEGRRARRRKYRLLKEKEEEEAGTSSPPPPAAARPTLAGEGKEEPAKLAQQKPREPQQQQQQQPAAPAETPSGDILDMLNKGAVKNNALNRFLQNNTHITPKSQSADE